MFATEVGTEMDAANIRRGFRRIVKATGINPAESKPRELPHSFVSLLSRQRGTYGGHRTRVTEAFYRRQLGRSCSAEPSPWIGTSMATAVPGES